MITERYAVLNFFLNSELMTFTFVTTNTNTKKKKKRKLTNGVSYCNSGDGGTT